MTLLAEVVSALEHAGIAHALIGATALAVHGVSRATRDLDLLAVDRACLREETWTSLRAGGRAIEVRRGDDDDPLAGVVRIEAPREAPVDVVVGRGAWQRDLLGRAVAHEIEGARAPVVRASDLVLLKLYAGGPQDLWDIAQLLQAQDAAPMHSEVEAALPALPAECAELWRRVLAQRR